MQVRDLEKIYTGITFELKAEEMILKDKERIKKINESPFVFKKISIGIISGGADAANISDSFSFFSPSVYPFFSGLSPNREKGLGCVFRARKKNDNEADISAASAPPDMIPIEIFLKSSGPTFIFFILSLSFKIISIK